MSSNATTNIRRSVRQAIPHVEWIDGHGEWALIAWCDVPTVTLWPSEAEATQALERLHYCGHACRRSGRNHEVRKFS